MASSGSTESSHPVLKAGRSPAGGARICLLLCFFLAVLFPLSLSAAALAAGEGDSAAAAETEEGVAKSGEDPMAEVQARRADRKEDPSEERSEINFYGSARIRHIRNRNDSYWGDGGSRAGVNGGWWVWKRYGIFGAAEVGFNLLDTVDEIFNPKGRSSERGDDISTRLLYAGVTTPRTLASYGKNWSTWYQVTGFTDIFESTGASASGTYNAGTDGGNTGTGRADGVLQTRLLIDFLPQRLFKPFHLNIQVQHGEPVPQVEGVDYGTAFGASAILHTINDLTIGLAYNRADIRDDEDPDLRAAGIDGDAVAFAAGTRWYGDRWYLATVVSRLDNHETTGSGIYFDGWGWEVYGRFKLGGSLWGVGGGNWLEPDGGEEQAGEYRLRYGVLGLWYVFREFNRIVYFEARIDDSRNVEGVALGNIYTVGVRWDLP